MATDSGYSLTDEALGRISKVVRWGESQMAVRGWQGSPWSPEPDAGGVWVMVTGDRVLMTTTTTSTSTGTGTTTPTSTTTATSTTSGTGTTSSTTVTTTTTPAPRYVYPAAFVWRDIKKIGTAGEWQQLASCWAAEVNDFGLGLGCRYLGTVVENYNGRALVEVNAYDQDVDSSCTTTTTTTAGPCAGRCVWVLNEALLFELDSSTCSSGCDCPPPDPKLCPPDEGCATVYTDCLRGYERSPGAAVYCTTTTTATTTTGTGTSSTTTTTTTTPVDANCGTGCDFKFVPNLGYSILITANCDIGHQWRSGNIICTCGYCGAPDPDPCSIVHVPCVVFCVQAPVTPPCTGTCDFVWPDVPGGDWVLTRSGCHTGLPDPCLCSKPSTPGGYCNQLATTPCYTPGTPTVPGGDDRPPDTGGCSGYCYVRWVADFGLWQTVFQGCPTNCKCEIPNRPGLDDCDVAVVPCSVLTTTTSSTTTTTTTTGCSSNTCFWAAGNVGDYYYLVSACQVGCACPDPFGEWPHARGAGDPPSVERPCEIGTPPVISTTTSTSTTTTTTSSTTTTTTTTAPDHCLGFFCIWQCNYSTGLYEVFREGPACPEACPCPEPTGEYTCASFGYPFTLSVPCNGPPPDPPPPPIDCTTNPEICPDGSVCLQVEGGGPAICVPTEQTTTTSSTTTTTTSSVPCDCDADRFEASFGSIAGAPNFVAMYDFNGDMVIDFRDREKFYLTCPGATTSTTTTTTTTTSSTTTTTSTTLLATRTAVSWGVGRARAPGLARANQPAAAGGSAVVTAEGLAPANEPGWGAATVVAVAPGVEGHPWAATTAGVGVAWGAGLTRAGGAGRAGGVAAAGGGYGSGGGGGGVSLASGDGVGAAAAGARAGGVGSARGVVWSAGAASSVGVGVLGLASPGASSGTASPWAAGAAGSRGAGRAGGMASVAADGLAPTLTAGVAAGVAATNAPGFATTTTTSSTTTTTTTTQHGSSCLDISCGTGYHCQAQDAETYICAPDCVTDSDCGDTSVYFCASTDHGCYPVSCTYDFNCYYRGDGAHKCQTSNHACVFCLVDADCPEGQVCDSEGNCTGAGLPCSSDADCSAGYFCGSDCANASTQCAPCDQAALNACLSGGGCGYGPYDLDCNGTFDLLDWATVNGSCGGGEAAMRTLARLTGSTVDLVARSLTRRTVRPTLTTTQTPHGGGRGVQWKR